MATYIIVEEIPITRQEGDTADLQFVLPSVFDPEDYNFYFAVYDEEGTEILVKELTDWTDSGQTITAELSEADTKGLAGEHRWECEMSDNSDVVITIGKGIFTILPELMTESRIV